MPLLPVGRRVAVRRRLAGSALSDVVGIVLCADDDAVTLRRRDGTAVTVRAGDVVAARLLASGGPPRRISGEELQRVTAEGWPAPVTEPLGDWLLRAAGGFTGRANSVSVHGDPGVSVSQALTRVRTFYDRHGLPARAQVVEGSAWEAAFAEAGWAPTSGTHPGAVVLTAPIRSALTARPPVEPVPVHAQPSDAWLRRYGRAADVEPATVRAVLTGGDAVGFAQLDGEPGAPPAAIGRMVLTGAWAGMACVEVDLALRRGGLARRVVQTLLAWASARGARWCWVQTLPDNTAALEMYASYGFTPHSRYRYFVPPDVSRCGRAHPASRSGRTGAGAFSLERDGSSEP